MMTPTPYTATLDDGSQVLIDVWSDVPLPIEALTVAVRERPGDVWGPPAQAVKADAEVAA